MEKIWWHEHKKKENSTWHLMTITSISISKFIQETEKGQKNSITRVRVRERKKMTSHAKNILWPHKVAIIASVALQQFWNEGHTQKKYEDLGAFEKAMKNVRRHFNNIWWILFHFSTLTMNVANSMSTWSFFQREKWA